MPVLRTVTMTRYRHLPALFLVTATLLSVRTIAESPIETNQLSTFQSDGCSWWPDGTSSDPDLWRECCVVHDIAYWKGGTREERVEADRNLLSCVAGKKQTLMGLLMFVGVRSGGGPSFFTPFRWGYGWSHNRGYEKIGMTESRQVQASLLGLN